MSMKKASWDHPMCGMRKNTANSTDIRKKKLVTFCSLVLRKYNLQSCLSLHSNMIPQDIVRHRILLSLKSLFFLWPLWFQPSSYSNCVIERFCHGFPSTCLSQMHTHPEQIASCTMSRSRCTCTNALLHGCFSAHLILLPGFVDGLNGIH